MPEPILEDALVHAEDGTGPRPGDCIGRYTIKKRLGVGGMGIVFAARDRVLGRRVALKVVRRRKRPGPHDATFEQRLHREAQALARLSHPNVVGLYDLGLANNIVFLAMEFIAGRHLASWASKTNPDWRQILDAYVQAGRGLAAAHAAGIVHRDFKPTNAIVAPDGKVRVVDFGLACGTTTDTDSLDADDSNVADMLSTKLTDTNVVLGTRGYMAPEQLLGLPVGPPADQFAFCVSLFEALYEARPYPGRNAVETARAFASEHLIEPPDRRGVPLHVHRALLRGLAVEPTERFASMDELLAALLPPPSSRRRRLGLAALVVVTAALSASTTAYVGAQLRPSAPVATASITCEEPPAAASDDPP